MPGFPENGAGENAAPTKWSADYYLNLGIVKAAPTTFTFSARRGAAFMPEAAKRCCGCTEDDVWSDSR
jgi:hypothetical protein